MTFDVGSTLQPHLVQLLYAVVGWVTGILSAPLSELVTSYIRRRRIASVLKTEVAALRDFMVAASFSQRRSSGVYTQQDAARFAELFASSATSGLSPGSVDALRTEASISPAEFERARRDFLEGIISISARRMSLPFLSDNVTELGLFSPAVQARGLDILTQLGFYNDVVDEFSRYQSQARDGDNHAKTVLDQARSRVVTRTEVLISACDDMLKLLGEV